MDTFLSKNTKEQVAKDVRPINSDWLEKVGWTDEARSAAAAARAKGYQASPDQGPGAMSGTNFNHPSGASLHVGSDGTWGHKEALPSQEEHDQKLATAAPKPGLGVPEKHQHRIAQQTMKMNPAMAGVMGGPNHDEARQILSRNTGLPAYPAPKETVHGQGAAGLKNRLDQVHGSDQHTYSHNALIHHITRQDEKDSQKPGHNKYALPQMFQAADRMKQAVAGGDHPAKAYADQYVPTRSTNAIQRKMNLGLGVDRGQWTGVPGAVGKSEGYDVVEEEAGDSNGVFRPLGADAPIQIGGVDVPRETAGFVGPKVVTMDGDQDSIAEEKTYAPDGVCIPGAVPGASEGKKLFSPVGKFQDPTGMLTSGTGLPTTPSKPKTYSPAGK